MSMESSPLHRAIALVEQERSQLDAERRAFEEFREAVRLATPDSPGENDPLATTVLRDTYQSAVMDGLDYRTVYGDTLAESIEQELSPSLAGFLCSEEPFTQRRKRQLLVATTSAIEQRAMFDEELADECANLDTYAAELSEVSSTIDALPECSPRRQSLESLLTHWERYDALAERCERLLERRQRQLADSKRTTPFLDDAHAFNEYLYENLDSPYPVLSAIARTCEWIESKRGATLPRDSAASNR